MYITPRDDCDNATYSHGTPDTNTRGSARYSFLPPSFPSSQARHELGQGFASKKIEVASLAIRSATPSIDFHTNCKLQLPFTPALPPYENDEMKSSINDITPPNMDSLSMKTRNMLMALQRPMEKEKTQKHQRKTVTFSDRPPLIYEIERCDALLMENSEGCADEEIASSSSSDERSSWDATLVENEPTHAVNKDESVSIKSPLASGQLEEKLNTTDSIAYASNLAIQRKGQRISRDEVLNLLAKRKEVQKIAGLQTQASRTPSFDIEKSQYQSMNTPLEEQILEAIRRAKLATASSYSGKEATHQDDLMRFKDTISKSKYDGPIYPATSSLPEATVLEHSENYDTHTHTTEDGCDPDDDENPVRNSVTSHSSDTFNSLVCSTPLDGEEQADNTTKISECENESDDEYNDCQEDFIEGNEGTSILAVSNPVSDFGKSLMSEIARITGDEIFATNPPNKQNIVVVSSEKPVITYEPSTCERNEVLAPENMPSSRSQLTSLKKLEPYHNNEGRLYIRVTAAENLDFPIDQDNHRIRCVLNYGTTHYTTEFQVMEHTIRFSHEFQIDTKKPITEFTLTLQISDNEKYEDARFKKIFAYRKRHHDVGIWRYANHTDGSICQSRVPIGEIVDKCILKVCNASFALVNGWYRQERTSILASRIKKKHLRHEKAVGKISAQFFFIPHTVSPKVSL
ncbi:uncharacterized protein BYT42DRAFT_340682 [Radiomyces spectabilis]|uniref:uncharacterized protein n=1 Tax=Radiomyces spectabilis TaxID=64574 RepID=UPI0022209DE9|nr:uncharacterized protein BYT42DRAFT_340682 [Radiomyces spectabilis]KAI8379792.1 hypothetical protein BYT42DRAFT_340682 [Radiomyces spectabilis]